MSGNKIKIISSNYFESSLSDKEENELILEFLKERKNLKLMSKQDKLSLIAAGRAWKNLEVEDRNRVGIYFCSGILPFEDKYLQKINKYSQNEEGEFSYSLFSTKAFHSLNPLLTFKCLPNMPLFHISYNLDITGRYFITYPDENSTFSALENAIYDLENESVDFAIVGAVADQNNFLVRNHVRKIDEKRIDLLKNCSASIILTRKEFKTQFYVKSLEQNMSANYFDHYFKTAKENTLEWGPVRPLKEINDMISKNEVKKLATSAYSLELGREL